MKKLMACILILSCAFAGIAEEKVIKKKKVLKKIHEVKKDGAFLGVTLKELKEGDDQHKVIILDVFADSGAEAAGLISEDMILKINGEEVTDIDEIRAILKKHLPDEDVPIIIERGGDNKEMIVKLGHHPEHLMLKHLDMNKNAFFIGEPQPYMGIHMKAVEGQLAEFFGVKSGILVEKVEEDSPASTAGLSAGDVIVSIGETEIAKTSDITDLLKDKEAGNEIAVKIIRRNESLTLPLVLGEKTANRSFNFFIDGDNVEKWIDKDDGEIIIERIIKKEE